MKLDINNYPGSKSGSGVAEWIINHIPEIQHFHELFAGSARISECLSTLCPEMFFNLNELSIDVYHQLRLRYVGHKKVFMNNLCGLKILEKTVQDAEFLTDSFRASIFLYLDPPYLMSTRRSQREIYEFEWIEHTHDYFLKLVQEVSELGYKIMISHYPCEKYDRLIENGWYHSDMNTINRAGKVVTERIYMNYDIQQLKLATPIYLGKDRTDRQRIRRKVNSLRRKIKKLSIHEKQLFKLLSAE